MPESSILRFDENLLTEMGVQWLNIIILVVLLYFLLYKPVKKFLEARRQKLAAQHDDAHREAEKARELREKYEALLAGIEAERDVILREGREAGLARSEELITEARREAANIYRRSMEDLRMEQENSMDEMRRAMIEISTQMAARFVTVSVDRETQDRYIDEALSHLEETLWEE